MRSLIHPKKIIQKKSKNIQISLKFSQGEKTGPSMEQARLNQCMAHRHAWPRRASHVTQVQRPRIVMVHHGLPRDAVDGEVRHGPRETDHDLRHDLREWCRLVVRLNAPNQLCRSRSNGGRQIRLQ